MIKALKLQKTVYILVLGILLFVLSSLSVFESEDVNQILLVLSGILLIIGALWLLYPIIFAKKISPDSNVVKLETGEVTDELKV